MIIKKKSLVVVVISGFIICCVLVLTLVGYLFYLELKDRESKESYKIELEHIRTGSQRRI